jgi:hypothetical protein
MLESQDYKYRHYHYSQAYGHASGGYGDGWTGDFFLISLVLVKSGCNE